MSASPFSGSLDLKWILQEFIHSFKKIVRNTDFTVFKGIKICPGILQLLAAVFGAVLFTVPGVEYLPGYQLYCVYSATALKFACVIFINTDLIIVQDYFIAGCNP